MSKTFNCAVLFLLISGTACVAQSDQPSLGDLARKHRGEVKQVKTLTNDDVATVHPSAPTASASSAPAASATALTDGGSSKPESKADGKQSGSGSAATKDTPEIAELKSKISSYKTEQDGWKAAAKRNQDLLAKETDDFRRQM